MKQRKELEFLSSRKGECRQKQRDRDRETKGKR